MVVIGNQKVNLVIVFVKNLSNDNLCEKFKQCVIIFVKMLNSDNFVKSLNSDNLCEMFKQ